MVVHHVGLEIRKISSHCAETQLESAVLKVTELLAERERERASSGDSDVDHSAVCFLCWSRCAADSPSLRAKVTELTHCDTHTDTLRLTQPAAQTQSHTLYTREGCVCFGKISGKNWCFTSRLLPHAADNQTEEPFCFRSWLSLTLSSCSACSGQEGEFLCPHQGQVTYLSCSRHFGVDSSCCRHRNGKKYIVCLSYVPSSAPHGTLVQKKYER